MKKSTKILLHFDFLTRIYFWLGILQIAIGVYCGYGCYALYQSDDPLILRIIGCVILGLSSVFIIFVEGISHISETIKANKNLLSQTKLDEEYDERTKNQN